MDNEIGNRLVELRKKEGLSQEELADRIRVSRQAISKWERGESLPETDNLLSLSSLYGVSVDYILKGEPSEAKTMQNTLISPVIEEDCEQVEAEVIDKNEKKKEKASLPDLIFNTVMLPLCLIGYLLIGFFWFSLDGRPVGWASGWVLFLLGIFAGSVYRSARVHSFSFVAFPILIVAIYCGVCIPLAYYGVSLWHPLWLLFILIPIYYPLAHFLDMRRAIKKSGLMDNPPFDETKDD